MMVTTNVSNSAFKLEGPPSSYKRFVELIKDPTTLIVSYETDSSYSHAVYCSFKLMTKDGIKIEIKITDHIIKETK